MTCAVLSASRCSTDLGYVLLGALEKVAILTFSFMHIPIYSHLCLLGFSFKFCCQFNTALYR